jgi:transcriptional regulator with XRE-family HTH domain
MPKEMTGVPKRKSTGATARRATAARRIETPETSRVAPEPLIDGASDGLDPRTELTALLRAWRQRRKPEEYPDHPELLHRRRRFQYLTGEDVAILTGVTPTWYRQFEGCEVNGYSDAFLERVAEVLKLDGTERTTMFLHATGHTPVHMESDSRNTVTVGLRVLIDALNFPAYVLDRAGNILARNQTSLEWFPSQASESSIITWLFHNQAARNQYTEWSVVARSTIAGLRAEHARTPYCPRLRATLRKLLSGRSEASAIWKKPQVSTGEDGRVRRIILPGAPSWTEVEVVTCTLDRSFDAQLHLVVPVGGYVPGPGPEFTQRMPSPRI